MEQDKDDKDGKQKDKKASFRKRLCAYLIDIFVVSLLASLIVVPFIDAKSVDKLDKNMVEVTEAYLNNEIDEMTFLNESESINYQLAKLTGTLTFVTIIIKMLYFIVFQLYNKGQTLGKSMFGIRVQSNDLELTANQMILRTFIIDSIFYSVVGFALMIFASSSAYFYGSLLFEIIQSIIMIICACMVMFRKDKRGLHDIVSRTSVIEVK